jgi:hypothetical protein
MRRQCKLCGRPYRARRGARFCSRPCRARWYAYAGALPGRRTPRRGRRRAALCRRRGFLTEQAYRQYRRSRRAAA